MEDILGAMINLRDVASLAVNGKANFACVAQCIAQSVDEVIGTFLVDGNEASVTIAGVKHAQVIARVEK